ncbi:hypothetical protein U1Q18_050612 [Sarracenia purpurea var. burkii]
MGTRQLSLVFGSGQKKICGRDVGVIPNNPSSVSDGPINSVPVTNLPSLISAFTKPAGYRRR